MLRQLAGLVDVRDAQLSAVPGHGRVVPADPGGVTPVRAGACPGHEVVAGREDADAARILTRGARDRKGHQVAADVRPALPGDLLPDAPHLVAPGTRRQVAVPEPVFDLGCRGDRPGFGGGIVQLEEVDALVGPVREGEQIATVPFEHHPGPAAVLVQPVAHVPRRTEHFAGVARRVRSQQSDPAALGGTALRPPHLLPVGVGEQRTTAGRRGIVRADRRGPGAVAGDRYHIRTLSRSGRGGGEAESVLIDQHVGEGAAVRIPVA